jgi:uncharacterized membrane protein
MKIFHIETANYTMVVKYHTYIYTYRTTKKGIKQIYTEVIHVSDYEQIINITKRRRLNCCNIVSKK